MDLRKCCMSTQGCWFNMLLIMWDEKEQGKIVGTKEEICRVVGCDSIELQCFFDDDKKHHFANVTICNNKVTIINRRMHEAYIGRENTKKRVAHHRAKAKVESNAEVTPFSSSSSSSSSSKYTYTLQQVLDITPLIGLDEEKATAFFNHYDSQGWLFGNSLPITNLNSALQRWKNSGYRFEKSSGGGKAKTRLFPIPGKTCSKCRLPAVYKNTKGAYDSYACAEHMPEDVKEMYE